MTPARVALALYPPSWRARYGDEVLAYLDDSGGGPAFCISRLTQTSRERNKEHSRN